MSVDLLLWRHAHARDGFPDHERPLTPRGLEQARRVARWLRKAQPDGLRVLCSPAARAQQTARTFCEDFEICPAIGVTATAADLLQAAGWPDAAHPVLLVGHQPTLGRVASLLLSGVEAGWSVRKGALWWFSLRGKKSASARVVLRTVVAPDLPAFP